MTTNRQIISSMLMVQNEHYLLERIDQRQVGSITSNIGGRQNDKMWAGDTYDHQVYNCLLTVSEV